MRPREATDATDAEARTRAGHAWTRTLLTRVSGSKALQPPARSSPAARTPHTNGTCTGTSIRAGHADARTPEPSRARTGNRARPSPAAPWPHTSAISTGAKRHAGPAVKPRPRPLAAVARAGQK